MTAIAVASPMKQPMARIAQVFDHWPQLRGLLDQALALPAAAREPWLAGLGDAHAPWS